MRWVSERDLEGGAGVRLFCLPHAGSGAAAFYRWKRVLPEGIRVCPVLLPGREIRLAEAPILRASEIVGALHAEVGPRLRETPYAIFGHSMGALLAYEWARSIQAEGLAGPDCLFLSGRDAPQVASGQREPGRWGLHRLGDAELVVELNRRYGGVPEGLLDDEEMRSVFLPILRADLTVVETYAHGPGLLRCPASGFAGAEDRSVSDAGLEGWGELTEGEFSWRRFPGDHFYHSSAGERELLCVLEEALA